MTIYSGNNYRKIYEHHHGPIPKDEDGRSYDIHHIDGNRKNNDPNNLIAVSIKEHYDIHYKQKDWGACFRLAQRMKLDQDAMSKLMKERNRALVKNGEHHWQGPKNNKSLLERGIHPSQISEIRNQARNRELTRIEAGTHKFKDNEWQKNKTRKAVERGTHNFLGGDIQRKTSQKRVIEGTHNLLAKNDSRIKNKTHHFFGGDIQRQSTLARLKEGTHPSQIKRTCELCNKTVSLGMYKRWHGNNCRNKDK